MSDRIIGDLLEINAEINEDIFTSNAPGFIKFFMKKYYTLKMLRIVKKIEVGNVPLNKKNLIELAEYIHNNYQPDCRFLTIKHVRYFEPSDSYVMRLEFGNTIVVFNIHDANNPRIESFTCKITPDNSGKSYEVELKEMITDNPDIKATVITANSELYKVITEYILTIIGKY